MKTITQLIVPLLLWATAASSAETWRIDNETYAEVKVLNVSSMGVTIEFLDLSRRPHKKTIPFEKLSDFQQVHFKKVLAEETLAEEKNRKAADNGSVRIKGRVIQIKDEGFMIECQSRIPVTSSMGSVGGGGHLPPADSSDVNRPHSVQGIFFVTGHPSQSTKVDNEWIDVDAIEDGVYNYTGTDGLAHRVKKFKVIKTVK